MDFKLRNGEQVRTVLATKDTATVIEAGDLVALSSGLIIKAVDESAAIAYAPKGAAAGVTEVEVTVGNDFELEGTASGNFAVTDKGTEVDLVVESTVQHINLEASSTDVFKVAIDKNAGTAGSAASVIVKINKPLF
jgi:Ca2+-binding RTX toxin-like protein